MDSARYPPPGTNSGSAYLDWMVDASLTEIGYSNQATPTLSSQLYPNVSENQAYSYLPTYYITEPTVGAVTQPSLAITTSPTLPAYYEYAPQGPVAVPHFLTPSTTPCPRSPSQLSGYPYNFPPDYFLSSGKGIMPGGRGRAQRNRDRNVPSPTSSKDFTERVSSRASRSSVRRASSSLADTEDVASQSTARDMSDDEDDECRMSGTSSAVTPSEEPRKVLRQNHSEIEKRRRDKMNTYITELSKVVPMCITMSHKMDKLTVLRMAVQHLKTIRGAIHSYTEGDYKPAFLSDEELKRLILHSADGFLFVVGCDRGRILYVSETVSQVLNYSQADLLGQSWFDILHPKDVAKVKEQLSSSDLSPRERLIDAKTMLPVKTDMPQGLSRLCPGARRSFFCRMKCKSGPQYVKEEADSNTSASVPFKRRAHNVNKEKRYSVIHCTGYLKSWAPAKIGMDDQDSEGDIDPCNLSCLVAVGRVHPSAAIQTAMRSTYKGPELKPVEFTSRHAIDGKFLFIDQRATLVLGYLPQEMLGTSMYEYYLGDDIPLLTEAHKVALQSSEYIVTPVYKFRVREGSYVRLQSRWKSFRNPWTKEIECLVAKNTFIHSDGLVESSSVALVRDQPSSNCSDLFSPGTSSVSGSGSGNSCSPALRVRGRSLNMDLESSKIGQAVVDHVLDSHRRSNPASNTSIASSGPSPSTSVSNIASPEAAEAIFGSVNLSNLAVEDVQRVAAGFPNAANMELEGNPTVRNGNPFPRNGILNNHQQEQPNQMVRTNPQLLHMLNEAAGLQTDQDMIEVFGGFMMNQESTLNPSLDVQPANTTGSSDGHDEAAMAVVMSLLEADAGLGGPVDFSGLPWPLP